MYSALKKGLPGDIQFNMPVGGMYFWLTFPESIFTGRDHALFETCLKKKVIYVPGEYCYMQGLLDDTSDPMGSHKMRVSYGTVDIQKIEEGVKRLVKAVEMIYSAK